MNVGAGRKVEMKIEEEKEIKKEEETEEKRIEIVTESENHKESSEDLIAE